MTNPDALYSWVVILLMNDKSHKVYYAITEDAATDYIRKAKELHKNLWFGVKIPVDEIIT